MKKSVEDQIKGAVESWEDRPTDLGFDKYLVWNAILAKQPQQKAWINWYKIAVAVILLFLTWGWGDMYLTNRQLQFEKDVLAQSLHDMSDQIVGMQQSTQEIKYAEVIQTDTVIKIVNIPSVPTDYIQLVQNSQQLKDENNALWAEKSSLTKRLSAMMIQYQLVTDSLAILAQNLKKDVDMPSQISIDTTPIILQVDTEALALLSNRNAGKANASSSPKNKIKIVLFNKSESYTSEAPATRGIIF